MKKAISVSTCVAALAVGWPASAQDIDNIGNQGQIVVGAERLAGVFWDSIHSEASTTQTVGGVTASSTAEIDTTYTSVALFGNSAGAETHVPRLALDYLAVGGFSIGGSLIYLTESGELEGKQSVTINGSTTSADIPKTDIGPASILILAPRIGYAVAFNEIVGFWPRLGFTYARSVADDTFMTNDLNGNQIEVTETVTTNLYNVTLEALLFVSPFSHFALVGGPFVDIGTGGDVKFESDEPGAADQDADVTLTTYGLTAGIAAYF